MFYLIPNPLALFPLLPRETSGILIQLTFLLQNVTIDSAHGNCQEDNDRPRGTVQEG